MIKNEPHPLSMTDNGGKIIANKTLKKLIFIIGWLLKEDDSLFVLLLK
jgi:hypothetical protein